MSAAPLALRCAGAAKGLVQAALGDFSAAHGGARVEARFGPVGALRDDLRGGTPCDVLLVTEAMARELAAEGELDAATLRIVGRVATAVAVRAGAPRPDLGSGDALRRALLGAGAVHVPDVLRSTAGRHVLRVLERLGIRDRLGARLHDHPGGGAAAMPALAAEDAVAAIGIAQASEIAGVPGVELVATLPPGFDLVTAYAAAVPRVAVQAALGRAFVDFLAGPRAAQRRVAAGFVEPID